MSSAQEVELGTGYINAKELIPSIRALEQMGHVQGQLPIQLYNKVATSITNNTCKQK